MPPLSARAQQVQDALRALGVDAEVRELPASTRTAAEAAASLGCEQRQIAKSLLFRTLTTDRGVLVVASGANRVNERAVEELVGEPVELAHPDFVKALTGYAVGGVPPVAHAHPLEILIDEDLMTLDELWAAAGTPHAVFPLTPGQLRHITRGRVAAIA